MNIPQAVTDDAGVDHEVVVQQGTEGTPNIGYAPLSLRHRLKELTQRTIHGFGLLKRRQMGTIQKDLKLGARNQAMRSTKRCKNNAETMKNHETKTERWLNWHIPKELSVLSDLSVASGRKLLSFSHGERLSDWSEASAASYLPGQPLFLQKSVWGEIDSNLATAIRTTVILLFS
jgi:hypothetical protein